MISRNAGEKRWLFGGSRAGGGRLKGTVSVIWSYQLLKFHKSRVNSDNHLIVSEATTKKD